MRQGIEPRGILGAGTVIVGSDWGDHWDEVKAQAGKRVRFVRVRFDTLLDFEHDVILARDVLNNDARFEGGTWDSQMSGTQIKEPAASELEKAWVSLTNVGGFTVPEEIPNEEPLYEGAKQRVWVNAYERSQAARRRCVAHYGMACVICGFGFLEAYGDAGEGFIHVHHLTPLSEIGEGYEVDPIRDLRPVCANCHAILHRCQPPYTIEEVKGFLEQARR
jgi:5-methylcytosine-specific restriction protein A